ncbi:MAG TPA: hypothetical protein VMH83_00640 [Candidatus Acidoferrum sp.]|nr:hypothetical protein [Candidatus Acidoferrum sp.]
MQEDRRQPQESTALSPELVQRGKQQLESEIRILETWLQQLDETRKDNPESLAARKAYTDMLQSRKDLLAVLRKQG